MSVQKQVQALLENDEYRAIAERNPGVHTYVKNLFTSKLRGRPDDELDICLLDVGDDLPEDVNTGKAICSPESEGWVDIVYHYEDTIYIQSMKSGKSDNDEPAIPESTLAESAASRMPFGHPRGPSWQHLPHPDESRRWTGSNT